MANLTAYIQIYEGIHINIHACRDTRVYQCTHAYTYQHTCVLTHTHTHLRSAGSRRKPRGPMCCYVHMHACTPTYTRTRHQVDLLIRFNGITPPPLPWNVAVLRRPSRAQPLAAVRAQAVAGACVFLGGRGVPFDMPEEPRLDAAIPEDTPGRQRAGSCARYRQKTRDISMHTHLRVNIQAAIDSC